jgi:RNA polymerase sigma-70 factor (ECF subfamily)
MTESDFRTAFREHKDAVYRFAWRMTNSPFAAEDITQDVFLFLLRQPSLRVQDHAQRRSFLLGVARNLALKRWRDEKRWEPLDDEQVSIDPIAVADSDVVRTVAAAVGALPFLQREVLILAEYEELSLDEIARAVESEVGAVKARLHRARENLRRMLAPLKNSAQRS